MTEPCEIDLEAANLVRVWGQLGSLNAVCRASQLSEPICHLFDVEIGRANPSVVAR